MQPLLLRNVLLNDQLIDIRCRADMVADVAPNLPIGLNDLIVDAKGGSILPGLHDHHIHLLSLAAQNRSVICGPPALFDEDSLASALCSAGGSGWIRGVSYHESVAGDLSAEQIDRWVADRPVRIQHRSGRLWYLNTLAKRELGLNDLEDGQLIRNDQHIRDRLSAQAELLEDLREVSSELASYGITHVTDATPSNDDITAELLRSECIKQSVDIMGGEQLSQGHYKIILDDFRLPQLDELADRIRAAHQAGRAVAIHCVSRVEIVFALVCLRMVGAIDGDRLEHATELSSDLIDQVLDLGIRVVPNPNFIFERGDDYIRDNEAEVVSNLYPIRSLLSRSAKLAAGCDAPFGSANPWIAIKAATDRKTRNGKKVGRVEAIEPEEALTLFLPENMAYTGDKLNIQSSSRANFCILDRTWGEARDHLDESAVIATIANGELTYVNHQVSASALTVLER